MGGRCGVSHDGSIFRQSVTVGAGDRAYDPRCFARGSSVTGTGGIGLRWWSVEAAPQRVRRRRSRLAHRVDANRALRKRSALRAIVVFRALFPVGVDDQIAAGSEASRSQSRRAVPFVPKPNAVAITSVPDPYGARLACRSQRRPVTSAECESVVHFESVRCALRCLSIASMRTRNHIDPSEQTIRCR